MNRKIGNTTEQALGYYLCKRKCDYPLIVEYPSGLVPYTIDGRSYPGGPIEISVSEEILKHVIAFNMDKDRAIEDFMRDINQ